MRHYRIPHAKSAFRLETGRKEKSAEDPMLMSKRNDFVINPNYSKQRVNPSVDIVTM